MLQYKYSFVFSFLLYNYTETKSPNAPLPQAWSLTSHPFLKLDRLHVPCIRPPHSPHHHSFTPPHNTASPSGVGVCCLSEPVKTALILITPWALLLCFVSLHRQSLHNHLLQTVLSKGQGRVVKAPWKTDLISTECIQTLRYKPYCTQNVTVTTWYPTMVEFNYQIYKRREPPSGGLEVFEYCSPSWL